MVVFLTASAHPLPVVAQVPTTMKVDVVFYADNAELFNPFRAGETILGGIERLYFDLDITDRVRLRLGAYGDERYADSLTSGTGRALPIVSISFGPPSDRLILGTLETGEHLATGPDRMTPHGLLPPLALETLWFTRSYESGVQWRLDLPRFRQDVWYNYQKLNTREHRELFDAGVVNRLRVRGPVAVATQFHLVHHGGQQFDTGPVSDSVAYGPGLILEGPIGRLQAVSVEGYALGSYEQRDRSSPANATQGAAVYLRGAVESHQWRAHASVWRGKNFLHEEGDPNYLSQRLDGTSFQGVRHYAEAGLARMFRPAPAVDLEMSLRLHRVEEERFGYSYRIVTTLHQTLWHVRP